MIGVALKGLLGRKLRATLTAFAIVLGVAMISGTFVLTDTLSKSLDGIYRGHHVDRRGRQRRRAGLHLRWDAAPRFSADLC